MVQTPNFAQAGIFQIQHQHLRPMPGNAGTDLFTSAGQMNGTNMLGKTIRQSLSNSGVIMVENYTQWLHTSPMTSTASR